VKTPALTGFQIRRGKYTSFKDPKKIGEERVIDFRSPHELGDLSLDVQVPREDLEGLAPTSDYYVVLEIRTSGPHPRPWARLPRLPVFDNKDAAQKVAIKVEYLHTGRKAWVPHYVYAIDAFTITSVPGNVSKAEGYLDAYWRAVTL